MSNSIVDRLKAIGDKQREIYEAGKAAGGGGSDEYYNTFWDNFQVNGNRQNYLNGFYGTSWNDNIFKPKYKTFNLSAASWMFNTANITKIDSDIVFNFNKFSNTTTRVDSMFSDCKQLTEMLGTIDLTGLKSSTFDLKSMFNGCSALTTVNLIKLKGIETFTDTFKNCSNLINIDFEGEIGNSIDFSSCTKLSKQSFCNVIDHLKYNDSNDELTITFSKEAKNQAGFIPQQPGEDGMGEWTDYIILPAEEYGWTISLI